MGATALPTREISKRAYKRTGRSRACVSHQTLAWSARQAGRDGARSADDREQAAAGRNEAGGHRRRAAGDRGGCAPTVSWLRPIRSRATQARGAGLADLRREIDRARRTTGLWCSPSSTLTASRRPITPRAPGGDRVLREVAGALREATRWYDLIMRFGGDEFLCAVSRIDIGEVERRFDGPAKQLPARSDEGSVGRFRRTTGRRLGDPDRTRRSRPSPRPPGEIDKSRPAGASELNQPLLSARLNASTRSQRGKA